MLKHGSPDDKGLDELQRLASSGRTSIPVDKDTPKSLYRTIGYRVCGERAIRVDILERLADLIRPALAWREGSSGVRPAGRVQRLRLHRDRRDDVAHRRVGRRLRLDPALARLSHGEAAQAAGGRRAARRTPEREVRRKPKRAPPSAELRMPSETPIAAPDDASADGEMPEADPAEPAPALAPELAPEAEPAPDADAAPAAEVDRRLPQPRRHRACGRSRAAAEAAPSEPAAEAAAPPPARKRPRPLRAAEPEMIEVWRPGPSAGRTPSARRRTAQPPPQASRRSQAARPRLSRPATALSPPREPNRPLPAADASGGAGRSEPRASRPPPSSPPGRRATSGERQAGRAASRRSRPASSAQERPEKRDRPARDDKRPERDDRRPPRRDRDRDRDRRDDNRPSRTWSSSEQKRGGKEPDPNSPFAKLLALKEQLEGNKDA